MVSRLVFISDGYGTKPDAWRIALSGYWLWDHGEFYPSRLPGYPVAELSYATVARGGWIATDCLAIAVSLLGIWYFASIVRELKLPAIIVVGFAFQPLLWINSMNTMDYTFALTFILGAYYYLLRRRSLWAGLAMGLAIGSRLPSAAMLIPFVMYLWRDGKRADIIPFAALAGAVALAAFTPIIWTYGPRFLNFYDAKVGYRTVIRLVTKDAFGLVGTLALVGGSIISLRRLARVPRDVLEDKQVMVWVMAIVLFIVVFSRLPHEAAYLIPAFPFLFLLIGRYFSRIALIGTVGALIIAGFGDLTTTTHAVSVASILHLRAGQGMLLSNRDTMRAQRGFVDDIERFSVPHHSVVMIGFVYPQFAVLNRDRLHLSILSRDTESVSQLSDKGKATDEANDVIYVWLLNYEDLIRYQAQGYDIWYTPDAGRSTVALYGYRPGLYGGHVLKTAHDINSSSNRTRASR